MICDHIRDLNEFKFLYNHIPLPNQYDWDFLINNPNLFCFYGEDEKDKSLKGYITVQRENDLLTLSGASIRKNMTENIKAIIMVCKAFDETMYSFTDVKPAKICLLKAGFKHVKDNKYVRYKHG